jgi:hypothetical protein
MNVDEGSVADRHATTLVAALRDLNVERPWLISGSRYSS